MLLFLEISLQKKASPMSLAILEITISICHSQNDSHDRSAPSSSQEPVVPDVTSDGISEGYEMVSDVGDKPNEWVHRLNQRCTYVLTVRFNSTGLEVAVVITRVVVST